VHVGLLTLTRRAILRNPSAAQTLQVAEKNQIAVILSEAKNLSLFFFYTQIEERFFVSLSILRSSE
jgi:hypothetical protein